jgi:glucokinase
MTAAARAGASVDVGSNATGGALAVGVDLGGTRVRAALVDEHGRIRTHAATRTDVAGGPRSVVAQITGLVAEVTRDIDRGDLAGVGLCAPGPLDGPAGVVIGIPTLPGWVDIPITAWLADALALPVTLENDGVGAAIGEWRFGAGRGLQDFVYVTVSTGIGGGVIADGHVLRGRRQLAAHVGHMTVDPAGEVCLCGNRGCWEAQASGTAFGAFARRRAAAAPGSRLARLGDTLDARQVMAAARDGDALALELVAHEAEWLGIGIVSLLHLFSPDAVVLGGGVSDGFDLLRAGIDAQVQRRAMPPFRSVPVRAAALGQDSGVVGAASLMLPAFRAH